MNREVPTLELRGCDQVLLEAHLPDLLRRPIGQIAPINVMDLVELASTEGRPRTTERILQAFVVGLPRQLADIPRGRSWELYLIDLEELPADRVPLAFRRLLEAESRGRSEAVARADALLARWGGVSPTPFSLNDRTGRVQRATMVEPPKEAKGDRSTSAPRERKERGEGGAAKPKTERTKVILDIERNEFVIQQCLERLSRTSSDKGLLEAVLIAGVRHAGKEKYPDLVPNEITGILRGLKDKNRVKYSAGRWMAR